MDRFIDFIFGMDLFLVVLALVPVVVVGYLYFYDRSQKEHSVLRNYPILGKVRYFLEKIGPELRQYLFHSNREGLPFSRSDYESIVKKGKYLQDLIGFGSDRDFDRPGYYIRNTLFPKQEGELRTDPHSRVVTMKYDLQHDGLFHRKETRIQTEHATYLLADEDAVVIGKSCDQPFVVKGLVGMSAMSYGSLGERAITALSLGLGRAGGTWMNTGEGGLSPYHLEGNVDLIVQIGPGLFGVRDEHGRLDWEELKRQAQMPQVKAFEVKLGQGAKIRGGHVEAEKITPAIAAIRKVKPYQAIDSPNRFPFFHDIPGLLSFLEQIRSRTGKPVGVKIVVGGRGMVSELAAAMAKTGLGPDFITVDGGEGGTGASFQDLADSVGLPNKAALMITDQELRHHGVRDRVKLIASGKLVTPDKAAVALGMGADLINIARGMMISVGCIQALKCHSNDCPVGVATTDEKLQRALVVEEKQYRVTNYVISLRKGLFRIAAAAGLESPVELSREHVVYQDEKGFVYSLDDLEAALGPVNKDAFVAER